MTVLCDTRKVAAADRFEFWSRSLASSFFPVRVHPLQRSPFNARLAASNLGPLQVFHVTAGACAPTRTAACVAAADPEQLQVHLLRHGRARVSQDGRVTETRAGDLTLLASTRPFTVRSDGFHDLLIFSMPLSWLGREADHTLKQTALRIPGREGLGARVGPFLSGIAEDLEAGSVAADDIALAEGIVGLVRGLCSPVRHTPDASVPQGHGQLRAQVRHYIEQHLHDPALSPSRIAAAHFVSTRRLHKLFESEETTLVRWIQHRRLERCCDDLRNPALAHESVAAIATRWGFRSRDTLGRLLRTTHGITARELRVQARAAAAV